MHGAPAYTVQTAVALWKTSKKKKKVASTKRSCSSAETADAEPHHVSISVPLITSVLPQSPIRCLTLRGQSQKLRQGFSFFFFFHNFCFACGPLVITHTNADPHLPSLTPIVPRRPTPISPLIKASLSKCPMKCNVVEQIQGHCGGGG